MKKKLKENDVVVFEIVAGKFRIGLVECEVDDEIVWVQYDAWFHKHFGCEVDMSFTMKKTELTKIGEL